MNKLLMMFWSMLGMMILSLCTSGSQAEEIEQLDMSTAWTPPPLIVMECPPTLLSGESALQKLEEENEAIRNEIFYGELELLVLLVHAEAGNQDFMGKQLVAEVVLNRVRSPHFPDTIEEVINQPGQFSTAKSLEKWAWGDHLTQDDFDAVLAAVENPVNDRILYFDSIGGVNGRNHFKHGGHWFGK